MCISKNEVQAKVKEYRQYKRIIEEAKNQLDLLQAEIEELMTLENTEILTGDDYKITWKNYSKTNFDSKTLKNDIPELYNKYSYITNYKKFLVS